MKIILKKDVLGLGYKDEVLTVKDGYGRNYLLPQGFAVLATEKALKALAEELKQRAHKIAKLKADAEAQAAKHLWFCRTKGNCRRFGSSGFGDKSKDYYYEVS